MFENLLCVRTQKRSMLSLATVVSCVFFLSFFNTKKKRTWTWVAPASEQHVKLVLLYPLRCIMPRLTWTQVLPNAVHTLSRYFDFFSAYVSCSAGNSVARLWYLHCALFFEETNRVQQHPYLLLEDRRLRCILQWTWLILYYFLTESLLALTVSLQLKNGDSVAERCSLCKAIG